MGLSGSVYCNCWKDAGLEGPVGFDEDGWLLDEATGDAIYGYWDRRLGSLRMLCAASLATGNPVKWG